MLSFIDLKMRSLRSQLLAAEFESEPLFTEATLGTFELDYDFICESLTHMLRQFPQRWGTYYQSADRMRDLADRFHTFLMILADRHET